MKKNNCSQLFLTSFSFVLITLFLTNESSADFIAHHWENQSVGHKEIRLLPEVYYFSSDSNFNSNGTEVKVNGLSSYTRLGFDGLFQYGVAKNLSLFARLSWARVDIDHTTQGGNSFGLTDQSLGLNYVLFKGQSGSTLHFQIQGDLPAYDNDDALVEGRPFLGDKSVDITGGLFAELPLVSIDPQRWRIRIGGGYTIRTEDFSAAIPWSGEIRYRASDSPLRFGLGGFGVTSVEDDSYRTTNGTSRPVVGGAGSLYVSATNSSHISGRGWIGYQVGPNFMLKGKYSMIFSGTTAPKGSTFGLGAVFRLSPPIDARPYRDDDEVYNDDRDDDGFVNYTFEAEITRVNDRLALVRINKGETDGVRVGQVYDVFSLKPDGSPKEPIARAKVIKLRKGEAALKVREYFKEVWIEKGFIVRRPLD